METSLAVICIWERGEGLHERKTSDILKELRERHGERETQSERERENSMSNKVNEQMRMRRILPLYWFRLR